MNASEKFSAYHACIWESVFVIDFVQAHISFLQTKELNLLFGGVMNESRYT